MSAGERDDAEADLRAVSEHLEACRRLCGGEPAAVPMHQPGCPYACSECGRPVPCRDHGWPR